MLFYPKLHVCLTATKYNTWKHSRLELEVHPFTHISRSLTVLGSNRTGGVLLTPGLGVDLDVTTVRSWLKDWKGLRGVDYYHTVSTCRCSPIFMQYTTIRIMIKLTN